MNARENIPADDLSAQDPLAGDGSGDPNKDREFLQDLPPAQVGDTAEATEDADTDDAD
ncbi:hypothetical protein [Microbacterium sp. p3-SID336]|uniref:hypothetical protein n=1 Tax=Microbacterium sp. p3-SID336 TaxID=2916212 RepID=UPI0021A8F553|nr:hypothetical protein [Microbacterium sp. p3-SID336]MCT1476427.1 hypothetical protein [Microbacterium sp. p3-SID336]